ncbi:hypothetical protein KFE25_006980 [Diacronema lutheri]|uniref:Mitochondrial carrier protein n=1 Tax=Diacronema lutheri TaxID=2081491 RepID=A0A8J5XI56_DIALT|nr:hypothetical protein KFE25_006980 [Diacronema lutheri]
MQAPEADCHFAASLVAAFVNYPLWRASAVAQSGFKVPGAGVLGKWAAAFKPPWRGVGWVLGGMTWARASIFYGSDAGKQLLVAAGAPPAISMVVPPMVISTLVQVANQPIIRASITIQDPGSRWQTVSAAMHGISETRGLGALWHGTSAGILKTVPKYCVAVLVKDAMDEWLPKPAPGAPRSEGRLRSAKKAVAAGVAGATITNPFDIIRNEMFKTDESLPQVCRRLSRDQGVRWLWRGVDKNLVSVAIPIAMTIYLADLFTVMKRNH